MLLLLALLHALLLLVMLLFQVLELALLLLLHLLFLLLVRLLLCPALALLGLLLFDALALLVLLLAHGLKLLLMLLLELRIAVRRRVIRWPSRRRPIVALGGPVIAGRTVGLSVRRRRVGPLLRIGRLRGWLIVALVRPVVAGRPIRLRIRRRRAGPPCVRWAIRLIRLHVIGPFRVGRRRGRPVVLRDVIGLVALLLHWAIHVLRRRGPVLRVSRRRCYCSRGRSHPHNRLRLLLLNLPHFRGFQWAATIPLNGGLLPLESRWRRRRSSLDNNRPSHDRTGRPCGRG